MQVFCLNRAYIDEVLPGSRLKVFFIDYGTSAVVDYSETCLPTCSESEIWELAPLVIPCIVKGNHYYPIIKRSASVRDPK